MTAIGLNNLGVVSELLGRYREAENLHRQALAIRTRMLGPEHPHTAYSEWNLGNVYLHAGRYAEAGVTTSANRSRPASARSGPIIPTWEILWFPSGLRSVNLGVTTKHSRSANARRICLRGSSAPKVMTWLAASWGVAEVCAAQGRLDDAEVLYAKALGIVESAAGPNHPDVAFALLGLAEIRRVRGSLTEAEPHFLRALALREQSHGETHPLVADSVAALARLRADQGLHDGSAALVDRATAIRRGIRSRRRPSRVKLSAQTRTGVDAIGAALEYRVAVVQAPAGWGKTTAVRAAVAGVAHLWHDAATQGCSDLLAAVASIDRLNIVDDLQAFNADGQSADMIVALIDGFHLNHDGPSFHVNP